MKRLTVLSTFGLMLSVVLIAQAAHHEGEWKSLFNGESLEGWTVNENKDSIFVEDGNIVCHGPRAHAFYTGPVGDHNFKNFHLKYDVMTKPGANSGVFIHTKYVDEGWPSAGYEIQVNNSMEKEPRKTGSVYGVDDVLEAPAEDNEWFTMDVIVKGKNVVVKVNGETVKDYTEDPNSEALKSNSSRSLSSGTIALQAHDPDSIVHFKDIQIKLLD